MMDWEKVIAKLNAEAICWNHVDTATSKVIAGILVALRDALKAGLKKDGARELTPLDD